MWLDILASQPTSIWATWRFLPAFVNAHTHLEFSELASPLPVGSAGFTDWLRAVMGYRRRRDQDDQAAARAVAEGLTQSAAAGVRAVGEIATTESWPAVLTRQPPAGVRFLELIGMQEERVAAQLQSARRYLAAAAAAPPQWQPGLSPHAPYTTTKSLVSQCVRLSQQSRVPIAMHVAETPAELQLLDDHGGPLRQLLEELEVWNSTAFDQASRPLDYLRLLSDSPRR